MLMNYPLFWVLQCSNFEYTVSDSVFAWNRSPCPLGGQTKSVRNSFTSSIEVVKKFGSTLGEGNTFWDFDEENVIRAIEAKMPKGEDKCAVFTKQLLSINPGVGRCRVAIHVFSLLFT